MKTSINYIMVIETSDYLHRLEANQFNLFTQKLHNGISKSIRTFDGDIIKHNDNSYIVSFKLATNVILSALKIQSNFKYITPKFDKSIRKLKIGIAHQFNTNDNDDAIKLATRMCEVITNQIAITLSTKKAYVKENHNSFINKEHIRTLNLSEKKFITMLMNYVETIWDTSNFSVVNFCDPLAYSKSQVYRKMRSLIGKSPSNFIRDFRLNRAMHLMHYQKGNITEIAHQTGFKSAAYFSKCFKDKFKILPSKYAQQHAS